MPTEHPARKKHRKHSGRKPKRSVAHVVEALARLGEPEDAIALKVNLSKNSLRRRHILDIARGRAAKAQAADMTRAEMCAADAILSAFSGTWNVPGEGNLLWASARNPADAFARWMLNGSKFITSGLASRFSRERLGEFAAVKAAAEKLLQKAWPNKT